MMASEKFSKYLCHSWNSTRVFRLKVYYTSYVLLYWFGFTRSSKSSLFTVRIIVR